MGKCKHHRTKRNRKYPSPLIQLPKEIWFLIFDYFPLRTLFIFVFVTKTWYHWILQGIPFFIQKSSSWKENLSKRYSLPTTIREFYFLVIKMDKISYLKKYLNNYSTLLSFNLGERRQCYQPLTIRYLPFYYGILECTFKFINREKTILLWNILDRSTWEFFIQNVADKKMHMDKMKNHSLCIVCEKKHATIQLFLPKQFSFLKNILNSRYHHLCYEVAGLQIVIDACLFVNMSHGE